MARMTHILLNISDWHTDTARLSKRAKGCYIDFLGAYYRNGGPLPLDERDLTMALGYKNARSLRVDLDELIRCGQIHVMDTPTGRVLVNNRSDEEIKKFEATHQGRVKGGQNSRPGSRGAVEMAGDRAGETAPNAVSSRYGADISSISARYHAENAPEIEQNQRVSGSSSSILNLITTTTQAHARGPVAVSDPTPEPGGGPAFDPPFDPIDQPAPGSARMSRIPTPAPSRPGKVSPSAHDPVLPRNAFSRTPEVPAEGTPEWDAYQRKQQRLAVTAKVEELCGDTLRQGSAIESAYVAAWLHLGADPELHIYPVVRKMVETFAAKGKTIFGAKIFDEDVRRKIDLEKEVMTNPSAPARSQYKSGGYGGGNASGKPKSPVPGDVMTTIKMASQNGWTELYGRMWELLKPANKGCEESLRLLNDLHAKHALDVLVPHSVWLTQHQSSAA